MKNATKAKAVRPKTMNRGAADVVAEILAKIQRMRNSTGGNYIDGSKLAAWTAKWDTRAAKKKGGLGKQ